MHGSTSPTCRLAVGWRDKALNASEVIDAIDRIGYRAHPFEAGRAKDDEARQARFLMRCLAVSGFAAMNIMLLSVSVWSGGNDMTEETRDFFHWLSALIALPAAAYAGQPFSSAAPWNVLRNGSVNMDVPISLGMSLALGMSVVESINHGPARLLRFGDHAAVLPVVRPALSSTLCGVKVAPSPAISPL